MAEIEIVCGDITKLRVDQYVNSANGLLLQGSGTAKMYADRSGLVTDRHELEEFDLLLNMAREPLKSPLDYMYNVDGREKSVFQYQCLKEMVISRDSRPFKQGDAVLIRVGDMGIANAIGMTYDWSRQPPKILPATYDTVYSSLAKSLGFAERLSHKSVAIPVMCTRKGGLSEEVSSRATLDAIDRCGDSLDKVFIVLYNDELAGRQDIFKMFYETGIWHE